MKSRWINITNILPLIGLKHKLKRGPSCLDKIFSPPAQCRQKTVYSRTACLEMTARSAAETWSSCANAARAEATESERLCSNTVNNDDNWVYGGEHLKNKRRFSSWLVRNVVSSVVFCGSLRSLWTTTRVFNGLWSVCITKVEINDTVVASDRLTPVTLSSEPSEYRKLMKEWVDSYYKNNVQ